MRSDTGRAISCCLAFVIRRPIDRHVKEETACCFSVSVRLAKQNLCNNLAVRSPKILTVADGSRCRWPQVIAGSRARSIKRVRIVIRTTFACGRTRNRILDRWGEFGSVTEMPFADERSGTSASCNMFRIVIRERASPRFALGTRPSPPPTHGRETDGHQPGHATRTNRRRREHLW